MSMLRVRSGRHFFHQAGALVGKGEARWPAFDRRTIQILQLSLHSRGTVLPILT